MHGAEISTHPPPFVRHPASAAEQAVSVVNEVERLVQDKFEQAPDDHVQALK